MNKTQHTPGPWNIRNPQIGTVKEDDGLITIGSDAGKHIATIRTGGLPYEPSTEAKANAALLASAPELLNALEAVLYAADTMAAHAIVAGRFDAMRDKGRQAIAKARGEA